jgi:hypothetical protein
LFDPLGAEFAGVPEQGGDGAVLGEVRRCERADAPAGRDFREKLDEHACEARAPPGGRDHDGDFGHAVASGFVLGDRDPMAGGGVDGHQREPAHVVHRRQVRQQRGRDSRRSAEEPAAQGVGIGRLERFG